LHTSASRRMECGRHGDINPAGQNMKQNLKFALVWLAIGLIAYLIFAGIDLTNADAIGTPIFLPIGILVYLVWKLIDRFKS
jgi:hypothetical protein